MFVVIYHWRVKHGMEDEFVQIWRRRTVRISEHCSSRGSRLYRNDEGTFVAIALWPSRDLLEHPAALPSADKPDAQRFAELLDGGSQTEALALVDDLWDYPARHPREDVLS